MTGTDNTASMQYRALRNEVAIIHWGMKMELADKATGSEKEALRASEICWQNAFAVDTNRIAEKLGG